MKNPNPPFNRGPQIKPDPPAAAERGLVAQPAALRPRPPPGLQSELNAGALATVRRVKGKVRGFLAANPINSIMLSLLQAPTCGAPS